MDLTNVGGTVFFRTDDGTHGQELWRSHGTYGGTQMVRDINPGSYMLNGKSYPNSSDPFDLIEATGILWLTDHRPARLRLSTIDFGT